VSDATATIVFWVVVRDKNTKQLLSATPFRTHDEAVRYNISPDGPTDAASSSAVSIEILATGKMPK
jgi:hypothetical protein